MKRCLLTVVFFGSLICTSTHACGESRKGPHIGLGLGLAPIAGYSVDYYCWYDESEGTLTVTKPALAFNMLLGYAWNERNFIALEFQMSYVDKEDPPCPEPDWDWSFSWHIGPEPAIYQIYMGPVWYHYFGPGEKEFFSLVGIGFAYHDRIDETDPGLGAVVGGGYEVSRNFTISLRYFQGTSQYKYGGEYRIRSLSLLFSLIPY